MPIIIASLSTHTMTTNGGNKYSSSGGALLGGVIANSINQPYSKDIIDDFAHHTHTQVIEYIPHSVTVTQSELQGKTSIEAFPNSAQAKVYRSLADKIANHKESKIPQPLEVSDLREWAAKWSDRLLAIETGEVKDSAQGI